MGSLTFFVVGKLPGLQREMCEMLSGRRPGNLSLISVSQMVERERERENRFPLDAI